jgi:hypothetical protein
MMEVNAFDFVERYGNCHPSGALPDDLLFPDPQSGLDCPTLGKVAAGKQALAQLAELNGRPKGRSL